MSKANAIQIRMGGYGPATTSFSKALKLIGDRLSVEFGDAGGCAIDLARFDSKGLHPTRGSDR